MLVISRLLVLSLLSLALSRPLWAAAPWLQVKIGVIGAGSEDILQSAQDQVQREALSGLLIQLDTPGGSLESTRNMVKAIMAAPYPVVVWVGPDGSRAGSAGAFITLAAHIAAMAPGTNIGAAHPVNADGKDIEGDAGEKAENDTIAFMDSIAMSRQRNAEVARSFVANSLSITATEALEMKVIDVIAAEPTLLLQQLNGRKVKLADGQEQTLETTAASLKLYENSWRQEFLEILANPNLFYLLFVAGLIGLGFELTHPGAVLPGVVGAISMILALIATSVLPVNFGGMLLLVASVAFMIAEVFIPSFGVLGIGGFIGFIIGSLLLVDPHNEQGLKISLLAIIPGAIIIAAFGSFVSYLVVSTQKRRVASGAEGMIGMSAVVIADFVDGSGRVRVQGEDWAAQASVTTSLSSGQTVRIIKVNGLSLEVRPESQGD